MDYSSSDSDSPKNRPNTKHLAFPAIGEMQQQVSSQFEKLNIGADIASGLNNSELMRLFEQSQSKWPSFHITITDLAKKEAQAKEEASFFGISQKCKSPINLLIVSRFDGEKVSPRPEQDGPPRPLNAPLEEHQQTTPRCPAAARPLRVGPCQADRREKG